VLAPSYNTVPALFFNLPKSETVLLHFKNPAPVKVTLPLAAVNVLSAS
jgi:hypothetical protein